MPISVHCDGCDRDFLVPDKFSGKKGKCKECGAVVAVPALGMAAAGRDIAPAARPARPGGVPAAPVKRAAPARVAAPAPPVPANHEADAIADWPPTDDTYDMGEPAIPAAAAAMSAPPMARAAGGRAPASSASAARTAAAAPAPAPAPEASSGNASGGMKLNTITSILLFVVVLLALTSGFWLIAEFALPHGVQPTKPRQVHPAPAASPDDEDTNATPGHFMRPITPDVRIAAYG